MNTNTSGDALYRSLNLYRKKPVVIEAVQWFSNGHAPHWAGRKINELGDCFTVETLEGIMTGSPGDWIIKGVRGEIYPCKPDIFAATYEKADGVCSEIPDDSELRMMLVSEFKRLQKDEGEESQWQPHDYACEAVRLLKPYLRTTEPVSKGEQND